MLCCLLIALAATPAGAWLIGPKAPDCCGTARAWALPVVQAFAAALAAALAGWAVLWLLLPTRDLFEPLCRIGAFLIGAPS